jgi:hypothetical protein
LALTRYRGSGPIPREDLALLVEVTDTTLSIDLGVRGAKVRAFVRECGRLPPPLRIEHGATVGFEPDSLKVERPVALTLSTCALI